MKAGVVELAKTIGDAVRQAKYTNTAHFGIIEKGRFRIGNRSYPIEVVVDCDTDEGNRVVAILTKTGKAVVVGA